MLFEHMYTKKNSFNIQLTVSLLFRNKLGPDFTVLLGFYKNVPHCITSLQNLRLMLNGCLQRHVVFFSVT